MVSFVRRCAAVGRGPRSRCLAESGMASDVPGINMGLRTEHGWRLNRGAGTERKTDE
jgi:hypothetical protein